MNCTDFKDSFMDRYLDNELNSKEIREFREHTFVDDGFITLVDPIKIHECF